MSQKEEMEHVEPEGPGPFLSALVFLVIVLASLCLGISMFLGWLFAPAS